MVLGITGSYCSGKSAVENILVNDTNFVIVDVDKIGHQVLDERKNEILAAFGRGILSNNGFNVETIDRKKLGKIVFSNKKKLKLLNSLVHPWMVEKIKLYITENKGKNICINAALLFEMGLDHLCDTILVIKASIFTIIKRAKKRDQHSLLRILKIITSQKVLFMSKKKINNADIYYIKNQKDFNSLKNKLRIVFNKIKLYS